MTRKDKPVKSKRIEDGALVYKIVDNLVFFCG